MIGLLLRLFRNLEKSQLRSWVLFEFEPQNAFFQQILQGSFRCLNALKACEQNCGCEAIAKEVTSLNGQLCER
jgi:hypothetical protein